MMRRDNISSLTPNPSSESPPPSSSTATTAFYTSDLNAARIENSFDNPIRPDVSSPPNHAHLESRNAITSPTATNRIQGGIPVAVASTVSPTTTTENDKPVLEKRPSVVIENKENEVSTSEMSTPIEELPTELCSRLRAAGFTLDPENRRSAQLREDGKKITPRVMLAASSPEPGRWREEERILVWSRSGSPLLEAEDLPEESVPVKDVATPSNQDYILEGPSKTVHKGKGGAEVDEFDPLLALEEVQSPWNAPTGPYNPWSKPQSVFMQASSKVKGGEKVVSFDPNLVSAEIPSPWPVPTMLYTSLSEEDFAIDRSSTVADKGKGKAKVKFPDPAAFEEVLSTYSTPSEPYASSCGQDAAVVNASSAADEGKQRDEMKKEKGTGVAGIEEWRRKIQHPLSSKPDLVSYKYKTKSSRARKSPPKKTSVGTSVVVRKDIKKELAVMEAKEARLIAASFSFTSGQSSSNDERETKKDKKSVNPQDVHKPVVPAETRKGHEKAAEELVTLVTRSDVRTRKSTRDFMQNTAQSRTPRTSNRVRQENKGHKDARESIPRSPRTSTFDAPTASSSSWTSKHPTTILKKPIKEISSSQPPTIASAQDISRSTRQANSTLRPDATSFLPSAQHSHTLIGTPSRAVPANHTPRRSPIPKPAWGSGGSPSTPLNRTVHNQPRGGRAAKTPSRAMQKKLDEAIDKHIEN